MFNVYVSYVNLNDVLDVFCKYVYDFGKSVIDYDCFIKLFKSER